MEAKEYLELSQLIKKYSMSKKLILYSWIVLLQACAVNYHKINIENYHYKMYDEYNNNIRISIADTNVFNESNNHRISRKNTRKKLLVLPVKLENISEDTIKVADLKIELFYDFEKALILSPSSYYKKINQKAYLHGIEILIGLVAISSPGSSGFSWNPYNPFNLMMPLGIYNINKAIRANNELKNDLNTLNVLDKTIYPHSFQYGIICVKTRHNNQLMIRLNK